MERARDHTGMLMKIMKVGRSLLTEYSRVLVGNIMRYMSQNHTFFFSSKFWA